MKHFSRRELLGIGLSSICGAALCSCSLAGRMTSGIGPRRNGPSVDIHCHIDTPETGRLLAERYPDYFQNLLGRMNPRSIKVTMELMEQAQHQLFDVDQRLRDMDALGVDIQVLSPAPSLFHYDREPGFALQVARIINDHIANVVDRHPDRFVGMCTVPLQAPELAVAELERCVGQLGLRGVEIGTHVAGRELTRSGLEGFFLRAEELGVLIFIHPRLTTYMEPRMVDYHLVNTIGNPLESTLALSYLIHDGYLERLPDLKICVAHGGGFMAAYSGRFDHPHPIREDVSVNIPKPPSDYLHRLYFDSLVFTDHQLRYLVETWGGGHILLGSDYPYDMAEPDPVGFVQTAGLSPAEASAVLGGNAMRLLGIS